MPISQRIDQLHCHDNAIAFAANTPFQNISNPECLPNLAQIMRVSITHYAGATDHAQIFDFGEARQDVVLDPISKECILLVCAVIFEWKNRNAFCVHLRFDRPAQQSIAQEKETEADCNERNH